MHLSSPPGDALALFPKKQLGNLPFHNFPVLFKRILAQAQPGIQASPQLCSFVLSALEFSFKKLCPSDPCASGCAASRGSSMENSNGKNRSRRFSVIKHRHKMPSVARVHRQDRGSQNHPGFPGFCRIIMFFMDYWDKMEKTKPKETSSVL